jgi:hypothetical protein
VTASVLALVLTPASDSAATRPVASPRAVSTWVTDGYVFAVAASGGVAYAGGDFELLALSTGSWVALRDDGRPDTSWPQVDGEVSAAAPDGRGGWFIGGAFAKVDGLPRRFLAHINPDRSLDRRWAPAISTDWMSAPVSALVRQGSILFVGGIFDRIGGKARRPHPRPCPTSGRFSRPKWGRP